jgi:hypothetical protein
MNQVLVTMFMNDGRTIVQTFGAAEEIKHVKSLADKATDTIIPYPPAAKKSGKPEEKPTEEKKDDAEKQDDEEKKDEEKKDDEKKDDEEGMPEEKSDDESGESEKDGEKEPAAADLAGKIDALFKDCAGFEWTPKSDDNYAKLAEISKLVTQAALLADGDGQKEKASEAAAKVHAELAGVNWDTSTAEALNKFATEAKPSTDSGICFVGVMRQVSEQDGKTAFLFQVEGADFVAIVPTEKAANVPVGTRAVVAGRYATDMTQSANDSSGKKFTAVQVVSKAVVTIPAP